MVFRPRPASNGMDKNDVIVWEAPEYAHRDKKPDWFWARGIIAACVSIISIIKGNTLFAVFIILGALTLGFYAVRKPEIVRFEINRKGVRVRNSLYMHNTLKGFWVDTHEDGNKLLIELSRAVLPIISLPLPEEFDPERLREVLLDYIPEKQMREPASDRMIEYLGL